MLFSAYAVMCMLMFFMEGLHRTRLLPFFILVGLVGACLLVPLAHKLPYTFQRALSFLPLDIDSGGTGGCRRLLGMAIPHVA